MNNTQIALLPEHGNILPFPTKSNEWYTPARYIEAARQVMGSIDLDPASCELANRTVKATRYYSKEDNGLAQEWRGNVWLNPPYGSEDGNVGRLYGREGQAKQFIFRLVTEYKNGNIKQAVLCVTSDTDAKWFVPLWEYLICFADHKVHFHRPGLSNMGQFFGTTFVYLGHNKLQFIDTFSEFGTVALRVSKPKRAVTPLSLWEGV